jgi:hypothetical protein
MLIICLPSYNEECSRWLQQMNNRTVLCEEYVSVEAVKQMQLYKMDGNIFPAEFPRGHYDHLIL